MRDYYDEINRRKKHEILFSELSVAELEQLCDFDKYSGRIENGQVKAFGRTAYVI